MKAKAIVFTAVNQIAVTTVNIPPLRPDEVLVQAEYSCISPGTELRCLAGTLQEALPYPFIPGYSLVGHILAVGKNGRYQAGQRVWCTGTDRAGLHCSWGGHVSHAIAPQSDIVPVPENVSSLDAVLGRLAAIAYHGLRLSRPLPHEKVAVAGLGMIGQLSARLHAIAGAEVAAADFIPNRVQLAQAAGVAAFVPDNTLADGFAAYFPAGADILVDATGRGDVAAQLIPVGRSLPEDDAPHPLGPRFLVQGGTDGAYTFPHQPAFSKEMRFLLPRDRQPLDVRAVFDLMRRGKLDISDLISDVRPPETAVTAYRDLQTRRNDFSTIVFQWS